MTDVEPYVFEWDETKNKKLLHERGISFEMVLAAIESGGLLDILRHKKPREHQRLYIIRIEGHVYVVPTVSDGRKIFMKTIYPSRKMQKKYAETNE